MERIENAKITYVQFGYEDHGILTLMIGLEGDGWGQGYGGYALDKYDNEKGKRVPTQKGFEAITMLMKTLDVKDLYDIKGKYVRIRVDGVASGTKIRAIGDIVKDKWFSFEDFFNN